jgi:hypothetical protein
VCFAVVNWHVVRVGEACPKCGGLPRSSIFLILKLLNTICITLKSRTRELYVMALVKEGGVQLVSVGVHMSPSCTQYLVTKRSF